MNNSIKYVLLLLFFSMSLQAQTTGKIAGYILDKNTGEQLVGVNIFIENSAIGATTDTDGAFFILNVPPGKHTVNIEYIGYKPYKIEELKVSVNRTSTITVELEEATLELGEEIVVVASKIAIKKDQTSSIRNVSSEDMAILPIENTDDIVSLQPGVVLGHMRGGRSNETAYMVDGISVYNGFNRTQTISVDPDALQDIEVITGTFDAKYGEAMGAVVNMVTKEGGNEFHGKFEGFLGNYYTSHNDKFPGLESSELDRKRDYKFFLHGPVIRSKLFFFFSTRVQDNLDHLNGIRRFNLTDAPYYDFWQVPFAYDENGNYLLNEHTGDGEYVPMSWNQSTTFTGKLTYKLTGAKMSLTYLHDEGEGQGYSHVNKYKPDGRNRNHDKSYLMMYQMNHQLAQNAFYELKFSYSNSYNGNYLYKDPTDLRYIHDRYSANDGFTGFLTGGQDKGHTETTTEKYLSRLDFTWQVNNSNNIEAGFEATMYKHDRRNQNILNKYRNTAASGVLYEPEVLDDTTAAADIYLKKPIQFAAWISDKMEYEDMVLNIGARVEYFNAQTQYPSNYRNPQNNLAKEDQPERVTEYVDADANINVAPRLGFSYKLGEKALLRFSYGHFYQYPPHSTMYFNNSYILSPDNYSSTIGNPQVKPEKTVNYEIGLWQMLNDYMDLEVALWYKDIYDLSTVRIITTYNEIRYGLYSNKDYGNARGLELKFHTQVGEIYSEINYTLQYTRGSADNPTFAFNDAGTNPDPVPSLVPMSWDQRHTFNATIGYNMSNYGATVTGYFGSGSAFTWQPIDQNAIHRVNLDPNNSFKPLQNTIDLKAFYEIPTDWDVQLRLTLFVYNVLDRLNENNVNGNTGRTNQAIIREGDLNDHWSDFSTYEERIYSPSNWSSPRLVKLGLGVVF